MKNSEMLPLAAAAIEDLARDQGSVTSEPADRPARIMIVDDEPINIKVVRKYLASAGYEQFITTTDSVKAIDIMRQELPDVVVLDIMMPKVDGLQILQWARADDRLQFVPILILTASTDAATKVKALERGATDFLTKPVDPHDLIPRIRNSLIVKAHHDHLADYSKLLEEKVQKRTAELAQSRQDVIHCLARAAEYRDDDTGQHIVRVGRYAGLIACQLGYTEEDADILEQAAQLHDVGKIGISDTILLKPGKLDPNEYEMMKKHCQFGENIIEPIVGEEWKKVKMHAHIGAQIMNAGSSPVLALASTIAMSHHEKWDGNGYPKGLAGEVIPLEGRITAVADVYDALSSKRPYKEALPHDKCMEIMLHERGTHFDPTMLDAFVACIDEIVKFQKKCAEAERGS